MKHYRLLYRHNKSAQIKDAVTLALRLFHILGFNQCNLSAALQNSCIRHYIELTNPFSSSFTYQRTTIAIFHVMHVRFQQEEKHFLRLCLNQRPRQATLVSSEKLFIDENACRTLLSMYYRLRSELNSQLNHKKQRHGENMCFPSFSITFATTV